MTGPALLALVSIAALLVPVQGNDPTDRPLALPALSRGAACPVSVGTQGAVPRQPHIFNPGLWFGTGPVLVALAWKPPDSGDTATFSLAPVPVLEGMSRAKTPWVSASGFAGPITVRGHALDDANKVLLFTHNGARPSTRLHLQAPRARSPELWSFWPTSMWIPGPGCYGLQIDTPAATDIVVFQAT